jgi:putative membrane protein
MARTHHRNGALIFVAPRRRQFVILADVGIAARVGDGAWEIIAAEMGAEFRRGDPTGALEHGIAAIGDRLTQYFPVDSSRDGNELADELVVDGGGPIR